MKARATALLLVMLICALLLAATIGQYEWPPEPHRAVKHLHDDRPEPTDDIYWPTVAGQENQRMEPVFDGKTTNLPDDEYQRIRALLERAATLSAPSVKSLMVTPTVASPLSTPTLP